MPPLHEALVEVHKEYAKASRSAKDMADMYKKDTAAAEILNAQCTASQAENQWLSEQVREAEELLKKITEEILRRPEEFAQEWPQKCQHAEDALKKTQGRAVLVENRTKTLKEQQHLAQNDFGNQLIKKDNMITSLQRQSAHQQDEIRHAAEQIRRARRICKNSRIILC